MDRGRFGNTDLTVSIIGLGCYGMSGAYGRQTTRSQSPLFAGRSISGSICSTHRPVTAKATIIA